MSQILDTVRDVVLFLGTSLWKLGCFHNVVSNCIRSYVSCACFYQGLDKEILAIVKALCEQGVNPEALAQVIRFLRKEGAAGAASNQAPHNL